MNWRNNGFNYVPYTTHTQLYYSLTNKMTINTKFSLPNATVGRSRIIQSLFICPTLINFVKIYKKFYIIRKVIFKSNQPKIKIN